MEVKLNLNTAKNNSIHTQVFEPIGDDYLLVVECLWTKNNTFLIPPVIKLEMRGEECEPIIEPNGELIYDCSLCQIAPFNTEIIEMMIEQFYDMDEVYAHIPDGEDRKSTRLNSSH